MLALFHPFQVWKYRLPAALVATAALAGPTTGQISGNQAVIVDGENKRLSVIDSTGQVGSYPLVFSNPPVGSFSDAAVSTDGSLALVSEVERNYLHWISLGNSVPNTQESFPGNPKWTVEASATGIAIAAPYQLFPLLWPGAPVDRDLVTFDILTNSVIDTLTLPYDVDAVTISRDGTVAAACAPDYLGAGNRVMVVDLDASGNMTYRGVSPYMSSYRVDISPDATTALAVGSSNIVDVLDLSSLTITQRVFLSTSYDQLADVRYSPDGTSAYAYNQWTSPANRSLVVFDVDASGLLTERSRIPLSGFKGPSLATGPRYLAFSADGTRLFVTDQGLVDVLDTATDAVLLSAYTGPATLSYGSITGVETPVQPVSTGPVDTDSDGLKDSDEAALGSDPNDPDTDDDGLLDGTEFDMAASGMCPDLLNPDSDGDTLLDGDEVILGTSTCNPDTDGDGANDAVDPMPLDPGTTSGFIEDTARAVAFGTSLLPETKFSAPNGNAARGRRNALSNKIIEAANLTATGDYQGAIDELTSLLLHLDDDPTPPDWMLPSSERDQLVIDINNLINWLQYEL